MNGELSARVRRVTGAAAHYEATQDGAGSLSQSPVSLSIVAGGGGYFLFRKDLDGVCISDTWHLTLQEAKDQAKFEFEVDEKDWSLRQDDS